MAATLDATGDGRTKVFASYGRSYARVPNDLAARALSADAAIGADYFDPALTQIRFQTVSLAGPIGAQTATHFSIAGAGADVIDPNVKLSYTNEYIVGAEHDVRNGLMWERGSSIAISAASSRTFSLFPIVAADLGIPGADSVDYVLTNPGPAHADAQAVVGPRFESSCAHVQRY